MIKRVFNEQNFSRGFFNDENVLLAFVNYSILILNNLNNNLVLLRNYKGPCEEINLLVSKLLKCTG